MCSGDLHINKDAVSQPIDEKLITKVGESIYSNEDISYNDEKEIDNTMKSCKLWANGIKISSSNNKTYFKGISSNGLKFEGWINPDTEEFESLYPVLEWQK